MQHVRSGCFIWGGRLETGLTGKRVLITGAAGGIGHATAIAFAQEGCELLLIDRDETSLRRTVAAVEGLGPKPKMAVADLSSKSGVDAAISSLLEDSEDRLYVLINNVGIAGGREFDDITDDDWQRMFEINFMSNIRVTRSLLPKLRAAGGVIINNASDLARQPEAVPSEYAAFKAALVSITKSLARAEAPRVRVNAVAPGPIWTPLWSAPGGFADALSELHHLPPRQAVDHEMTLRQLPMRRMGKPEEVANVIVFLASDLSTFVKSSIWGVDGGSIRGLL